MADIKNKTGLLVSENVMQCNNEINEVERGNKMKNMERKLPIERFSRVHRSFIIGMKHIKAFSSSEVEVNGQKIPIGKNYKDDFLAIMNSKNIL